MILGKRSRERMTGLNEQQRAERHMERVKREEELRKKVEGLIKERLALEGLLQPKPKPRRRKSSIRLVYDPSKLPESVESIKVSEPESVSEPE